MSIALRRDPSPQSSPHFRGARKKKATPGTALCFPLALLRRERARVRDAFAFNQQKPLTSLLSCQERREIAAAELFIVQHPR
jgi:hypothetical protein